MKNNTKTLGIFYLFTAALLYSFLPAFIRWVGSGGLPPMTQVFSRYIFAFIAASVYFFIIKRATLVIRKKNIVILSISAIVGYALTNLFFTYAILFTYVGNALFLFYSYAIITPVLGFFLLREKLNKFHIVSIILSTIALFLLFQPSSIPTWKLGGVFAILSAVGQSVYLLLRRKLMNYSSHHMMFINTLVGVIIVGVLSLLFESTFYSSSIGAVSGKTWMISAVAGLTNFSAWFCMTKGFEIFKASTGSIILLIEIVFGILIAFILFQEIPTILAFVGGLFILLSSTLVILKSSGK